jgi:hypothetical protein
VKHLDALHTNKTEKCNICKMVAENKIHLMQHKKSQHGRNNHNSRSTYQNDQNYQQRRNHNNDKQLNETQVCRFWMKGNCFRGENCRFAHQMIEAPVMCREGDYCLFCLRCKFAHADLCPYQENCSWPDCPFMHKNGDFLDSDRMGQAPKIQSYQDFPPFPQQMWRPW